jgi:hypothetical protein
MFIYCTKESDPIRERDQEIEGTEQLQVKRLQNILASNGASQERSVDL